jgi:hypothetical protein
MLSILFRYFSRILYDWYSMASFIDWWWLLLSVIGQQNCYMIYFLFAECGTCFVLQHCTLFASLFICFVFIYSGSFFMYLHYYDMFIDLQKDLFLIYWTISQVSLFRLVNRFCTDRPSLVSIVRYCGILL